ncbi:MAG: thioredoxin domain-containing protein, partial [Candidatus Latescibacterota bacterium]
MLEQEPGNNLGQAELELAYRQLASRFDGIHGGFGPAPKFPTPHNLLFLLRSWKRTGEPHALDMVEKTLQDMRRGGIYDHVGFGFHRYSVDQRWFLPHFEKMLYDQALLLMAYTEAYQATGKEEYRSTAEEICTYVLRDMTDRSGGFYSAEDADSEGEEGKFYLWSAGEVRALLGEADGAIAVQTFGLSDEGNYQEEAGGEPTGNNILYLEKPLPQAAALQGVSEAELLARLEKIRQALFAGREKRVHPYKDDKILTDWNGLMIAALAKAARAFAEPRYAAGASRAAEFILKRHHGKQGLQHRYRDGEWGIDPNIDDYAFLIWGLLELHETTFDAGYLTSALDLTGVLFEHFWDGDGGGFFFASDESEKLLVRNKEIYDGAVPSGNSVMMLNLLRLARMTARIEYEEKAEQIGRAFQKNVSQSASIYTQLLSAVDFGVGPSYEVVIVGARGSGDTGEMKQALAEAFVPNKVVLFKPSDGGAAAAERLSPFLEHQQAIDGKATAYVCVNFACEMPTTDINKMRELLGLSGR